MSLRHTGPWHYEFIAGRPLGHQWRVADADDDVVTDFATEAEARDHVQQHHKQPDPETWRA